MYSLALRTAARILGAGEARRQRCRRARGGSPGSATPPPATLSVSSRVELVELALGGRAIDLALDLVGDRQHPLAGVIEDDQGVEAGEQRVGQAVRDRAAGCGSRSTRRIRS